jgi:hypothetical protein
MPRRALFLLLAVLVAGCVVGDPGEPDDAALQAPTFDPEPDEATDSSDDPPAPDEEPAEARDPDPAVPDEPAPDASDSAESVDGDAAESPTPEDEQAQPRDPEPDAEDQPEPALRSRITDPRGDTESARLTSGPRYADLVGGLLERHPDEGYRLAIELDGGAPEQARDGNHTMNVATFYDITGDGHVDVEVWANLADGGWDTALFDNRAGEAAYSDDDPVTVGVEDDRLVLRFPLEVLEGAERFRWAVASEWGRYEQLGTPLSVRDEMPDDGRPAPFPG